MPVRFLTVLLEEDMILVISYEQDENTYNVAVVHRLADGVRTGYDLQP